ncbi:unnamed protein product [Plasmodium vivax]|uniref:(malaria parasite P. vivax) hypothetical protein n=1 Tax=Plasmodium vivax TaxID=5855 RepID=A0A8S4HKH3_PLAVI|nr:unnamed protein product [Plasmodium vivax]
MEYPDLAYYEDLDDKNQISELLKQLTLYKFYEEIDKEFYKKYDITHCKKCKEKLEGITNPEPELLKLCIGVCNFILENGNNKYFCNGSPCNNSCSHMKFRLHDHVMKINKSSDNINKFYEALKYISQDAKLKLRDCPIVNFDMSKKDFMNFKYLYEFLFNYLDIRHNIYEEGNSNKQLYCKNGPTVQILEDDPNNITNILFKVLIYLIPILTTFTLLYKFTPLGSLLRSRMNKRKNMLEHVYENNYDHLGNISKDEVPNSDSRDYNVLYQSDKNI